MNPIQRAVRSAAGPMAALLLWFPGLATAATQSPFTFATIGLYVKPGGAPAVPELEVDSTSGGVSVQIGTAPAAFGKVRADFGSVGFAMEAVQLDREVAGGGLWSDGFTVTGGTGSASAAVSTKLTGSVVGEAELTYALFASDAPFDLQAVLAEIDADTFSQLSNATRVLYASLDPISGAVDMSLSGHLTFTYGQPFYLLGGFGGDMDPGNSLDFYNSADFGISVPSGARLQPLSGTAYAAAVPEPATLLTLFVGLAGIGLRARGGGAAVSLRIRAR